MITGLDHVVLLVKDIAAATAQYEALFGRAPSWRVRAAVSAVASLTPNGETGLSTKVDEPKALSGCTACKAETI